MVQEGTVQPIDLAKYLEDANTLLFDTPVIGAEVYKSTDGGKTWNKTHKGYLDDVYYSYGYYFGKIHVDPNNANTIYLYGVPYSQIQGWWENFSSSMQTMCMAITMCFGLIPKCPATSLINDGGSIFPTTTSPLDKMQYPLL